MSSVFLVVNVAGLIVLLVVAGVRSSSLLPEIRPQDTHDFALAQQISQLEGRAFLLSARKKLTVT